MEITLTLATSLASTVHLQLWLSVIMLMVIFCKQKKLAFGFGVVRAKATWLSKSQGFILLGA